MLQYLLKLYFSIYPQFASLTTTFRTAVYPLLQQVLPTFPVIFPILLRLQFVAGNVSRSRYRWQRDEIVLFPFDASAGGLFTCHTHPQSHATRPTPLCPSPCAPFGRRPRVHPSHHAAGESFVSVHADADCVQMIAIW